MWRSGSIHFACMVQSRVRRPVSSARSRFGSNSILSKEERQVLPQLLKLLRSGALSSLLVSSGPVSGANPLQVNVPSTVNFQVP